MPTTNDPNDQLNKLTELAKGAVNTAVGLGVLGLQKIQVHRVELGKRLAKNETLAANYSGLRTETLRRASQLDSIVGGALKTVESSLHPVTGRLPQPARHVASVAQARFDELHAKVTQFLASASNEKPSTPKAEDETAG